MGDTVILKAAVDWLACKDVCIPGKRLTLTTSALKIGPGAIDPAVAKNFAARASVPVPHPWKLTYALGKTLDIYAVHCGARLRPSGGSFFLS